MKTKGKAKRLLTMLLAFVMVVGLIPTAAMAMDSQAEYTAYAPTAVMRVYRINFRIPDNTLRQVKFR